MTTNMNKGYVGYSMSVRAAAAYEDGEMPKFKWTKKAILAALEGFCEENDRVYTAPKGTKAELFERFVELKSWHHTSKFCNATDFYGIDEEAAEEAFEAMTSEQIAARDAAKKAAQDAELAERKAIEEREAACRAYEKAFEAENGYRFGSVAHFIAEHPEAAEFFTSKKGNESVRVTFADRETVYSVAQTKTAIAWGFRPAYAF